MLPQRLHSLQTTLVGIIIAYPRSIPTMSVIVDACNGSNHYGVGHSCAFQQSQGCEWPSIASTYCHIHSTNHIITSLREQRVWKLDLRPSLIFK